MSLIVDVIMTGLMSRMDDCTSMILYSSCAVAEYRGTKGDAKNVCRLYTVSRNKTSYSRIGYSSAHTHVIISFTEHGLCSASDFCKFIRENRLGNCVKSVARPNINHGGWDKKGGTIVQCVLFTPNHEALTKWYQREFDVEYNLK